MSTCPLLAKPCIQDKCMFWLTEEYEQPRRLEAGCLFIHQYRLARQSVVEQVRTIATMDKVASEVNNGFETIFQAARSYRAQPALPAAEDS